MTSKPANLSVGQPLLPDPAQLSTLMAEAIEAGWLTNSGLLHQRLEQRLAPWLGGGTQRLVSSGTMALMVALRLGGLPAGAEIITSPLSFAATVQAILWCGFRPVFADIEPGRLGLDPRAVKAAITPRSAAILPVHFMGQPCDVDALGEIARQHGLWLVYDAAHAFGLRLNGQPIAQWGDASAFSLHATKLMHCGEGGAVALPGQAAQQLTRMRNFGLEAGRMIMPGTNAKMSEAQAAMGLAVLEHLEDEITARRRLRGLYDDALAGIAGIAPLTRQAGADEGLLYYGLQLPAGLRPALITALAQQNILARDHFPMLCGPGTCLPDATIVTAGGDPIAPGLGPSLIALPFHGRVSDHDVTRIRDIIRQQANAA